MEAWKFQCNDTSQCAIQGSGGLNCLFKPSHLLRSVIPRPLNGLDNDVGGGQSTRRARDPIDDHPIQVDIWAWIPSVISQVQYNLHPRILHISSQICV